MIDSMFKHFIQRRLENYVTAYFKHHPEVKLVVVAGSAGKTSTKNAIATVLSQKYRVALHEGNHNTDISVPVAILGIEYPTNIRSLGAWISVFRAARRRIYEPTGVDVIVQELGTDHPGDMAVFARYLRPDIGVIVSITDEHMEAFGTVDAVAAEEFTAVNFSKLAIINRDDIAAKYASLITNPSLDTYGTTAAAEYRFESSDFSIEDGYKGFVITPEYAESFAARIKVLGEHSLRPAMGAVAVAVKLGMAPPEIAAGLEKIQPVPGRMNVLRGVKDSVIIDDTYNSSPLTASSALQTLYSLQAPQRIAILGSMNELGALSQEEHEKLGAMCDPSMLAWVITVGDEAEKYLAPAARARGCSVKSFKTAIDAGGFAHGIIEQGAIILAKGSQGNIYLEEAVKVLCMMTDDVKLVRQSDDWLAIKQDFFSKVA